MSTELATLQGTIELPDTSTRSSNYKVTDLHLSSFYGGNIRGKSLQLAFMNENNNYSHIQLSNREVINLIHKLTVAFIFNK